MDISAGIKKGYTDDDDFDYIFHLPTADPDRIIYRDPFKSSTLPAKQKKDNSMAQLSTNSRHSIKEIRSMLDPTLGLRKAPTKMARKNSKNALGSELALTSGGGGSIADFFSMPKSVNGSNFDLASRKMSVSSRSELKDIGFSGNDAGIEDDENLISIVNGGSPEFRAMPDFLYKIIHPNVMALVGFLLMVLMVIQVILSAFQPSS